MTVTPQSETPRILDSETVQRVAQKILDSTRGGGETRVAIQSWWNGELRWARNHATLGSDRRDINVRVTRAVNGSVGSDVTNQLDALSLEAVVFSAERGAAFSLKRTIPLYEIAPPVRPSPTTRIWSDDTYNLLADQRGVLARTLIEYAEPQSLVSAGYMEIRAGEMAIRDSASATPDSVLYSAYTQAQCSMTVRHPKGVGSGWAGLSSYDWSAIDSQELAKRALDKCVASLNPVAIEPGRYTAVLEPQAVYDLVRFLYGALSSRKGAEMGSGPFALEGGNTKLGLQIIDERISITHDPADPLLGVLPSPGLQPIAWIDRGILTTLSYDREYALQSLHENDSMDARPSFRMSGGDASISDMIQSTSRGLLVTRFSGCMAVDSRSLLISGVTRDGLWLIEHGKISKAVKNFYIRESPMFILNQVEQIGVPVPVFSPISDPYTPGVSPAIVPAMKVKDFSFTSMTDAI